MEKVVYRWLLLVLAGLLITTLYKGIPLRITVEGPDSMHSRIPISLNTYSQTGSRWNVHLTTDRDGGIIVVRVDSQQGAVQVFRLDDEGRLVPVDQE